MSVIFFISIKFFPFLISFLFKITVGALTLNVLETLVSIVTVSLAFNPLFSSKLIEGDSHITFLAFIFELIKFNSLFAVNEILTCLFFRLL